MAWHPLKRVRRESRRWLLRRLPTCESLLPLMSASLDRKLTVREKIPLYLHFFVCKWCVDYAKQISFLGDVVRFDMGQDPDNPPDDAVLSDDAKARIKRTIRVQ